MNAQNYNPLIPSKKNDRLIEQAEKEKKEREAKKAAVLEQAQKEDATEEQKKAAEQIEKEEKLDQEIAERDSAIMQPIKTEDLVKTEVEYDPVTGNYIIHSKIGDTEISSPTMVSPKEYAQYSESQMMHRYWQEKIASVSHSNERKFDITDMKFNIGPADKVFGPGGVQLKLQGSAEFLFGFKHQYINNPSLTQRARNNNVFDFNEKIQASVTAKVGDKIDFKLNYNTESSFSFDQQNLKLTYKGHEDDIIQSIEAGNVTMDLNSTLIKGSKALFGIKTNLKFGKLTIQALVSQQNSQSQSVSSEGGVQTTKFEIGIEKYDENRHFFLGNYFRDKYESAMQNLPYPNTGVTIKRIEVWVTNRKGNYDNSRNIIALVDLGEENPSTSLLHIHNNHWKNTSRIGHAENRTNSEYDEVSAIPGIRDISQVSSLLGDQSLEMEVGTDWEKLESARLLSSSEYTVNTVMGFISLKQTLQEDEVLAVAYEYTVGGQTYQVGEFSTDKSETLAAPNALIVKLLKGTNNSPEDKAKADTEKGKAGVSSNAQWIAGTWPLMMKNVYSLGATNISSDKFELGVYYRNDSVGTSIQYISEGNCKNTPLIRVLGLDRLDSRNNTYPDGKFDFVEGYTILSSTGRVIFPVLEPFGSALSQKIGSPTIASRYIFQELYDSTLVSAQEMTEKNKFVLKGKFKGSAANQINLGAMNVPRGSVTVTAGGATLVENVDYTVDYISGIVTILNENILSSGTAVNVSLENQSTFSMTRKTLVGAHIEYAFSPDFVIGGTIMNMSERPLTTKVNTGSEPICNTIWGMNLAYKTELPWLNTAINSIPWMKATAPSSFQIQGEFAHLIPGHTSDVGKAGTAYIDDFESATTEIDIHYPSAWHLSATPQYSTDPTLNQYVVRDAKTSGKDYNKNRALLNWYTVDPIFGYPQSNTPQHVKDSVAEMSDHRIRLVYEREIYPNKESSTTEDTRLSPLNLSFYPLERGPYNIDATQYDQYGNLQNPAQKWGGIMRRLDNTNFESSNIEYIEFWLMDPDLTNPDYTNYNADVVLQLGDVSEDILHDGKKSFEHGLPVSDNDISVVDTTCWGVVPKTNSSVVAFSNESGARRRQDVGLNGLSTENEFAFTYGNTHPYQDYVTQLRTIVTDPIAIQRWTDPNNPQSAYSPLNDPAGDNYHYYRGTDYDNAKINVLNRYKYYNGVEGNSPATEDQSESYGTAATLYPDVEDVNSDNTLNENEKFWEYIVHINHDSMRVGSQHITSEIESRVTLRDGSTPLVKWYQFKIPIRSGASVNNMKSFTSIRFMRMLLTNSETEFHLRFGAMSLVRGDWREYTKALTPTGTPSKAELSLQAVNIEEDGTRSPVNYVLPPGVSRQTDPGQAQLIAQNEQSLDLKLMDVPSGEGRAIYKGTSLDIRNYKKLQMFVHAEKLVSDIGDEQLQDNDMHCFIRLGTDLKNNYYEYDVPLKLTPHSSSYNNNSDADRLIVWPEQNYMDFPLAAFTRTKTARNKAKRSGSDVKITERYTVDDSDDGFPDNLVTVIGNPTLEDVAYIMIGVRNTDKDVHSADVWCDELRLCEFDESGGVAAQASAALAISDIAQFNVSGRLETVGYGSIESNVTTRNMEDDYQLSLSAALEAGRLFPEKAKLQIPLYVSYSAEKTKPKYNPLDTDIKLSESLEGASKEERDSINSLSNTVQTSTTFSVTNLKVNIHSKKKDMFYDPANFSLSASYSKSNMHSPEVERETNTEQKGSFNYSYNFNPKPWEPFKNVKKVAKIKALKELNFYYLPQMWSFTTNMHRTFSVSQQRELTGAVGVRVQDMVTSSKDFTWDRNFNFQYNLTKNLKFSLQTAMNSTVDEGMYAREVIRDYEFANNHYEAWRDTIRRSLAKWGSPYTYQQVFTMSWNVPFNRIPYLEALSATATYTGNYNWTRTQSSSTTSQNLGNSISSTRQWQIDGGLNLELLYGKSKYWKRITQLYMGRTRPKANRNSKDRKSKKDLDPKNADKDQNEKKIQKDYNWYDIFAYMGTSIRKVQVTYRRTDALATSGFLPGIGFFGQDNKNDAGSAPGWDFAFGFFRDDWINKAKSRGWLTMNDSIAQPATRSTTEDLDIRLTLEPLPGLKIQLNGKRYMANTTSITYTSGNNIETFTGSFNITQCALGTMFKSVGNANNNYASDVFNQFMQNRTIMRDRVQARYPAGAGTVSSSSADVLLPAFLAAYTGQDINKMGYSPFLSILRMVPNWSVTYDGLSKLPGIKDHFRSFTLTHAYTCKYSIGSYSSFSTWAAANGNDKTMGYIQDVTNPNISTPSSAYDIASVSLTESLSPLIGLNMTLKNSLSFKGEYRKQRNLALNVTSVQLSESHSDEFVIGAGYTLKDLSFTGKNMQGQQKKVSNDLKLNVDFGYKNIKAFLRKIDEGGLAQTSSGSKVFTVKIAADYIISQKLDIQLYYDHEGTTPLLSTAYPIKTDNVGVNVKLMLTR